MTSRIVKIKDNIIRFNFFPLSRWNLYCYLIIKEHHNYLIDTGCGNNDIKIVNDYIKENNLENDLIVICTHYHWDHIWGNSYTKASYIIAHEKCYQKMIEKNDEMFNSNKEYINKEAKLCLPNVTFTDELYLKEDTLLLFYSLGHTVDQISIYDETDKAIYVGDNIGDDEINIVPELESSKEEYKKSLEKIIKFDFNIVLSGHNEVQSKDFIRKIINKL